MKVTIDNLDGAGAVDYSAALCADGPLKIERVPEGSHWVVHEQPATVIRAMRLFLQ